MFYKIVRDNLSGGSKTATWFIKLEKGEEILTSLTLFCEHFQSYTGGSGVITGIGAVSYAEIGWFDPGKKQYTKKSLQQDMEITSLVGNLSLKETKPFFHVHITLANSQFEITGGHLFKAIISATGEFVLRTFRSSDNMPDLTRKQDKETGLFLWDSMQKLDEIG